MSALSTSQGFQIGDTVFAGPAGDLTRKATWKILSLWQSTDEIDYATVVSGLSGMIRTFPVSKLSPFIGSERVMEPAP